MNKKIRFIGILIVFILPLLAYSYVLSEDGRFEAKVTTDSGTYSVPVEVLDGEVVQIDWTNEKKVAVSGAKINDGEATGVDSNGDSVSIKLKDYYGDT
jgi:hypothetical protein